MVRRHHPLHPPGGVAAADADAAVAVLTVDVAAFAAMAGRL